MCTQCGERAKLTPTEIEQTVKVAGRTFVGAVERGAGTSFSHTPVEVDVP